MIDNVDEFKKRVYENKIQNTPINSPSTKNLFLKNPDPLSTNVPPKQFAKISEEEMDELLTAEDFIYKMIPRPFKEWVAKGLDYTNVFQYALTNIIEDALNKGDFKPLQDLKDAITLKKRGSFVNILRDHANLSPQTAMQLGGLLDGLSPDVGDAVGLAIGYFGNRAKFNDEAIKKQVAKGEYEGNINLEPVDIRKNEITPFTKEQYYYVKQKYGQDIADVLKTANDLKIAGINIRSRPEDMLVLELPLESSASLGIIDAATKKGLTVEKKWSGNPPEGWQQSYEIIGKTKEIKNILNSAYNLYRDRQLSKEETEYPHKMTMEELEIKRNKIQGSYGDIQKQIDSKIDELMSKGMSFEEADDSPEVNALYQKRWIIENLKLRQGYEQVLNNVKKVAPDVDANKMLKQVFQLSIDEPTSAYFAWNNFPKKVQNKNKTIKEIFEFLVKDYGEKNNFDMKGVLNPNISGWTGSRINDFIKETENKAQQIYKAVTSIFK